MKERLQIFPPTQTAIEKRLSEIKEGIARTTQGLASLGRDGDKIDDPQMYALLEKQELLRVEAVKLRCCLGAEIDFITSDKLRENEKVSIGHQVRIRMEEDEMMVTIGTKLDSQFLWRRDEFFGTSHFLISEDSPLARALLGVQLNQTVKYQAGDKMTQVEILEINISPLTRK